MTLTEYLDQAGIGSQRRLAETSGVSENTISQIARGRRVRDIDVARAVSRATSGKVTVAHLMGLTEEDLSPQDERGA